MIIMYETANVKIIFRIKNFLCEFLVNKLNYLCAEYESEKIYTIGHHSWACFGWLF